MSKRLGVFLGISLFFLSAHAQWSEKDSLRSGRILNTAGAFAGEQAIAGEKPALNVDITLPKVFPEKKEIRLSLRPYTANTKYNYDPVYRKKIDIRSDTWKYGEKFRMNIASVYSDMAAGGGSVDLMALFTKDFWDRKGRKRRARTLEVLQNYGDSTTIRMKEDIKKAVIY